MPHIAVTGAAGFIGRHVVAHLRDAGHEVVGIDRRPWSPGPGEVSLCLDLTTVDPAETEQLRTCLATAAGVIHLAGRPGVRDAHPQADQLRWRDNVVAGQRVLDLVPAATSLVVASSSSVYGGARRATDGIRPSHEDDRRRPRGGYARSKAVLEDRCQARRQAGGHVAVVRPFTVAGEGQRADMAIATWIDAARAGRPLTILGDTRRARDVTDVRDVARGIVAMLEAGHATTCNLGTGTAHTLATLASAVATATGMPLELSMVRAGREEPSVTLANTTRCQQLLGFTPTIDLDDLVHRQLTATTSQHCPDLYLTKAP